MFTPSVCKFHVNGGDISTSASLFFNVLFGDYDVIPADISLTRRLERVPAGRLQRP